MPTAKPHIKTNPQQKEVKPIYNQVKTLLSWEAPGRPFKKKHKSYYTTTLLIAVFIEVLLVLFSQYALMLVVISLVFVAFALASTPPHIFHYRISSEGVFVEDHMFLWQELYDFYFITENNQVVLKIRTIAYYPGEITLTIGEFTIEHIRSVLLPYLPFREYINPTFMEKTGTWLSKTFPLEVEHHSSRKVA